MELFKAHNQWATRPADERFWTPELMLAACKEYRASAVTSTVSYADLRVEADGGDVRLVGKTGTPARLTHYAFGQLCQRAGAPASYLRELPATLAAQNMNHGLKARAAGDTGAAKLLFHRNGDMVLRASLSESYTRIWNDDVVARIVDLQASGWKVPPARPVHAGQPGARPATAADVIAFGSNGLSVRVGDMIAPAGLYASDRDMFAFMVNEGAELTNPVDPGTPLKRGFFVWNSEVGDKSFGVMRFLYDNVCGNHIVWGARDVREVRVRHVGRANNQAFRELAVELRRYADSSTSDDQARLVSTQTFSLGLTKGDVVTKLLGFTRRARVDVTESRLEEAYDVAERTPRYGAPNTPWAIAQGLTELSQQAKHADERTKLDRAAGKVLEVAF